MGLFTAHATFVTSQNQNKDVLFKFASKRSWVKNQGKREENIFVLNSLGENMESLDHFMLGRETPNNERQGRFDKKDLRENLRKF